ncbi:hypothetical protein DFH09DRAFT_1100145 [Mycena vulgaris]|nr:hypothetical protein DFH09DRAFT_1100145 [Mycena vulgaris]
MAKAQLIGSQFAIVDSNAQTIHDLSNGLAWGPGLPGLAGMAFLKLKPWALQSPVSGSARLGLRAWPSPAAVRARCTIVECTLDAEEHADTVKELLAAEAQRPLDPTGRVGNGVPALLPAVLTMSSNERGSESAPSSLPEETDEDRACANMICSCVATMHPLERRYWCDHEAREERLERQRQIWQEEEERAQAIGLDDWKDYSPLVSSSTEPADHARDGVADSAVMAAFQGGIRRCINQVGQVTDIVRVHSHLAGRVKGEPEGGIDAARETN